MNMQAADDTSFAPPMLRKLEDTGLQMVMMRDILLKTIFRKNIEQTSAIAEAVCLPMPLTQGLIDMLRDMGLLQAMGTLHATSSSDHRGYCGPRLYQLPKILRKSVKSIFYNQLENFLNAMSRVIRAYCVCDQSPASDSTLWGTR